MHVCCERNSERNSGQSSQSTCSDLLNGIAADPPSEPLTAQACLPSHPHLHGHVVQRIVAEQQYVIDRGQGQRGRKQLGFSDRAKIPAAWQRGCASGLSQQKAAWDLGLCGSGLH